MPEGPELYLASRFINEIGRSTLFGGKVVKSEVSTKNPDVEWSHEVYRVCAQTRGKELKMTLMEGREEKKGQDALDIVFRFGMSGSFKYTHVQDCPKHAHLRFFTKNENIPMVLCFVDYRRFGRWVVGGKWGQDRGPDPMWEYSSFRENILTNLKEAAFNKPICETMLNQKYFNGIGNYLRAEILYRCGVRPFEKAREALSELKPFSKWLDQQFKHDDKKNHTIKQEHQDFTQNCIVKPDLLDLCHIVPKEVINLGGGGKGYNVDPDADEDEYEEFRAWLQCYSQDGMNNLVDNNKRTIWFSGDPGPLKPKTSESRSPTKRKKLKKNTKNEEKVQKTEADVHDPETGIKTETYAKKSKRRRNGAEHKSQAKKKTPKISEPKDVGTIAGRRRSARLAAGDK